MENLRVRLARGWAIFFVFASLIALAGCGSRHSPTVVSVEIDAAKAQMALGTAQQYSATALFSDGSKRDVTSEAIWSSTQPSVATVDNASPTKGYANTAALGSTFIVATFSSVSGNKELTVTPAALTAIGVTPAAPTVPKGMSKQLTATGTFTDGTTQDITSGVTWSSSDETTATVGNAPGSAGLAQTLKQGGVTVSAAMSGVTGSTSITVTTAVLSRVDIAPTNPSVPNGLSKQFSATGVFSDGTTQDLTTSSTWSSSNSSIATVVGTGSSAGLAQALAQGVTTISATNSGISGTTTLTVTAGVLASINVTPSNPSVPNGLSKQFTATGTYSDGTTQDITATVVWQSSTASVATISNAAASAGLAQGLAQGTSTISAQSGDITGSTTLTVAAAVLSTINVTPINPSVPNGLSKQFTATGTYTDGTTQNITAAVTWSSSNTAAATISNAPASVGLAQTLAQGVSTITAQSASITGSATLTVTAAELISMGVTPSAPTIANGLTQQFTATGTFTDGSTQNLTSSVTWNSSDTSIATISNAPASAGLAQSAAKGVTTISAAQSGITGTTTLTVTDATLVRLDVTPANPNVPKGLTKQFTATGVFTDGTNKDLTTVVTWASSDTDVAPISNATGSNGLASANAQGASTISAASQGVTGATSLNVTAAVLVSMGVTPSAPTIANGLTQQFTATGTFTDGSTQNLTSSVTWNSSDTSIATISNALGSKGLAQSAAKGVTTISAAQSGITGTTTLTVTDATLVRLDVTPVNPNVPKGLTKQFTATGVFTDGTNKDLTAVVTWASSNTSVAPISNAAGSNGLASANAQGTATISAASQGITGSTSLNVTAAVLVSMGVTPSAPTIANGLTQQFTATGTFTDGSTQNLTSSVTWNSSNSSVATISNALGSEGLAQSAAKGVTTISAAQSGVTGTTTLTVTDATLVRLDVTPASPAVPKGLTKQFTATGVFTDGTTQDLTTVATWASSNTNVAPISNAAGSNGLAAANAQGTATISAATQGVTGSTTLNVTAASLISIQVTPTNPMLPVGFTRPLTATGRYSDSTTQDITQQVTWGSTNTAAATVDNSQSNQGVATGIAAGNTTVTAQQGSIIGQTSLAITAASLNSIQVTPATASIALGNKQQFAATGTFSDSTTLDITKQVSWSSSNTAIATISNAADSVGLASSVSQGTVTISALRAGAGSGISGTANLTVSPKALVSINVSPAASILPKGRKVTYTATGTFTDGSSDNITLAVTWSSSNTSVATLSNAAGSNGEATAVATGQVIVTAQQGSVSGSTNLKVTAAVLSSISVTPSAVSVSLGLKQQYTATGTYSDNTLQDLSQTVTWGSSNGAVATVSNASGSNGLASTLSVGTTTITATDLDTGINGSTLLTVTPVALISISLTPANSSLPNGEFRQYSATGNYSDGTSGDLTQQVTWSSSNASIADVSNAAGSRGKAIAKAVGGVTIKAIEPGSGVFGTTPLTVTAARLVGINVTAASGDLKVAVGYATQYVAVGQYSDGSQQDITAASSWTSFSPAIAAVGNAAANKGLVQGIAVGNTSISVSLNGVSGTGSVQVTGATLSSIAVTPANATIHPNGTLQYACLGTFSDGSKLSLTQQVTWASSNTTAATISNAVGSKGLASAGGLIGTTTISAAVNGVTGSTQLTRALN